MASTKAVTAMENGLTVTAATAVNGDTGAAVTLDTGYGAAINVKITNGATGPTVACQVQIQTSSDNSEWYDFGPPLVGSTANYAAGPPEVGVASWGGIEIPIGTEYVRTLQGGNQSQNVTVDIDISQVTGV